MSVLTYLIPVSLLLGTAALVLFLWSLRSGQYEDLDGAAERILYDEDVPLPPARRSPERGNTQEPASKAGPESNARERIKDPGHHARSP